MSEGGAFSGRLLIGWIAAAVVLFAVSLYLMGNADSSADTAAASSYSRSAIGYAGFAEVLRRLDIPVVKSRANSLAQLTTGSVLVIAEPHAGPRTEQIVRPLLTANTILLVLPKWTGRASVQKPAWLRSTAQGPASVGEWALHLVAPQADLVRAEHPVWTINPFHIPPQIDGSVNLIRGGGLRPIIGSRDGMLLGRMGDHTWVLADPDVMSNHGLARPGNAALALAIVNLLRGRSGRVVFDETVHGFAAAPVNPLGLMFRFPFAMVTLQAVAAVALLLWATLGRFGAPQPAPPPIRAGREGLLQNIAKLVEFTGHQDVMVRRYVLETARDVARLLHAPRGLSSAGLVQWLQRVGAARNVAVDCGPLIQEAEELGGGGRATPAALVRLAREIHRWRGEIVDGRAGHPLHR